MPVVYGSMSLVVPHLSNDKVPSYFSLSSPLLFNERWPWSMVPCRLFFRFSPATRSLVPCISPFRFYPMSGARGLWFHAICYSTPLQRQCHWLDVTFHSASLQQAVHVVSCTLHVTCDSSFLQQTVSVVHGSMSLVIPEASPVSNPDVGAGWCKTQVTAPQQILPIRDVMGGGRRNPR